MAEMTVQMSSA